MNLGARVGWRGADTYLFSPLGASVRLPGGHHTEAPAPLGSRFRGKDDFSRVSAPRPFGNPFGRLRVCFHGD